MTEPQPGLGLTPDELEELDALRAESAFANEHESWVEDDEGNVVTPEHMGDDEPTGDTDDELESTTAIGQLKERIGNQAYQVGHPEMAGTAIDSAFREMRRRELEEQDSPRRDIGY